jgi:ankyrin repeat protein
MLLDAKADLEARTTKGGRPIHWAAEGGDVRVIKELHSRGAVVSVKDGDGATPLHVAATYGHVAAIAELAKAGGNMQADKKGETPLHSTVRQRHWKVIKLLVSLGADVVHHAKDGTTPMDVAVLSEDSCLIRALHDLCPTMGLPDVIPERTSTADGHEITAKQPPSSKQSPRKRKRL